MVVNVTHGYVTSHGHGPPDAPPVRACQVQGRGARTLPDSSRGQSRPLPAPQGWIEGKQTAFVVLCREPLGNK